MEQRWRCTNYATGLEAVRGFRHGQSLLAYPLLRTSSTPVPIPFRKVIQENRHALLLALLALATSLGWFFIDGDVGINLADEGYLWHGTEAMRQGQIPMRDFHAYDPGRYLWTVGWSYLLGESLVSLRLACVLFQCLGVFAGLLAVCRVSRQPLFLICIALLLDVWMHPRYKVFEQSIALMSVYAGVLLMERPTLRRHLGVGIFGGLMAFMGRNHGAYHVLAFGLIISWTAGSEGWREWRRRIMAWSGGLFAGYAPQWLMFICVPGYFRSFVDSLVSISAKGTNLAAAVPWPWLVPANLPGWIRANSIAEGCFYVALPLFLALAVARASWLGRQRLATQPVLVSAACVTLPYTHYVFSRPDIVHLTHGAPSMVLGAIALAASFASRGRWLPRACAPVILVASVLANFFQLGAIRQLFAPPGTYLSLPVNGSRMLLQRYHAQVLVSAHTLTTDLAKADEPVFFAPHMPGLYPFTGRLSPTKQIYFIFPATPDEDRALLAEIEKAGVQWVMLHDYALDGREDLRFRATNPIVFDFFRKNFEPVLIETLPRDMIVLHRIHHP